MRVRACVCLCSLTLQADGAEARPLFKDAGNDVEAIAAKIEEMYKARWPAVYSHTRACSFFTGRIGAVYSHTTRFRSM